MADKDKAYAQGAGCTGGGVARGGRRLLPVLAALLIAGLPFSDCRCARAGDEAEAWTPEGHHV